MLTKLRSALTLFCLILCACASALSAESYYRLLFERGVFMMEGEADLEGAVPIFQEIVKRHPNDRPYAARSLFYLGVCYKRMGSDLALQAFREVTTNYADQAGIVRMARAELAALSRSRPSLSDAVPEIGPQLIWTGEGTFGTGSLSRDGRFYIYVDRDSGRLRLLDVESRRVRPLNRNSLLRPQDGFVVLGAISPDVKRVAYGWHPREGGCELRLVDLDGAGARTLLSDTKVTHIHPMDWSADAEQILVCMLGSDLVTRVMFVNSRDGTVRPVREMGRDWPAHMRLSPDGRCLAYGLPRNQDAQEHDLFLYSIPDQVEVPLVTQPGNDRLLGWTPEGGGILYLSHRSGIADVFFLTIWKGRPRLPARAVRSDVGSLTPVGSTEDGRFFYEKTGGEGPRQVRGAGRTELWLIPDFFPEESKTLTVPDQFPSIQAAILASDPGDTVYVRKGVYPENLTIDRPLTLLGEDRSSTVIDGGKGENVIHVASSNVTVQGVTIMNGSIGVDIHSARPIRFVALKDCIVTANARDGIHSRNSGGDHTIEGCILSHNGAYAVNAHQFSRSVIRDCEIFENHGGLRVGWGWYIRVEGNHIYRNESVGLYPDSCYYSTFAGNLVHANVKLGIKLGYISSRNIFRENIILDNGDGIWISLEWGSYSRNRIYHNDVLQNQTQVLETSPGLAGFQEWDNGPLSGGNFWSDYTGQDCDGDGIGETPHAVAPGTIDQFPLMRPHNSIRANVTIYPELEEPESRNGWLEVHIALPAGLPIEDIERATLRLNDTVSPDRRRSSVGDFDADGVPELRIRFRWKQVLAALKPVDGRTISVSGQLSSGLWFVGSAALDLGGR